MTSACSAFEELPGTTLSYDSNGAIFTIDTEADAPTIITGKYLFFGRVDYEIQAAPGAGIVTSAVLESNDLDEIDWEWVGNDNGHAQTNYFSKGNTTTYNRNLTVSATNPTSQFNTYSVLWTSQQLQWLINDQVVRTLTYDDADGGNTYPQTPMQVKLGTWVGGCTSCAKGTVEWAGGYADMSDAPFKAFYKNVAITDYAGGDSPPDGAIKEYIYGDKSGTWQSIEVVKGNGSSSSSSSSASSSSMSSTMASSSATTAASSSTMSSAMTSASVVSTASSNMTSLMTSSAASKTSASSSATQSTHPTSAASRVSGVLGAAVAAAVLMLSQLI